jgi:cytochrome P450
MQQRIAELRAKHPVVWSTAHGGHWVVTGYEEVHEVLRDHATYSSWPNNLLLKDAGNPMLPIELDPPDHTAFRQALQPLFAPARMKALEDRIRDVVDELLDGFASRGSVEFVSEFAHELPARVFLALMGWPLEDAPLFTEHTDTIVLGVPGGTQEESMAAAFEATMALAGYFAGVVAQRREAGLASGDITDEIIKTPIALQDGTRELTDEELCNMFFLLAIAGLHTVQGSLAWGLMHLAATPDQRQQIIDDSSLIPDAVEEILRLEAAVSMGRRATVDTTLAGVDIKAGDQVLCILSAANRDGREFEDPDEVQIERSPNRHLSFGSGAHRCIGSHLARIELRIAFEEIHRRIPDYAIDTTQQTVSHSSQVRGVAKLPLIFTPEA